MPDYRSNATTIRKSHEFYAYLSIVGSEVTVLEGTLSATPQAYPVFSLAYTSDAGSFANVLPDMEIEFFRAGVSKGRLRVGPNTVAEATTATVLVVEEYSRGRLALLSGDTFKVYREFRPRHRLVAANADFDKDSRIQYGQQNAIVQPMPNGGGSRVGFLVGGSKVFTHSSLASFNVDSDSDPNDYTVAWDSRGFSYVGGSSATSYVPQIEYTSAGTYWIGLTVTDNDAAPGVSAVKYVPVRLHDDDDPPLGISHLRIEGNREAGWRCVFRVYDRATLDEVPDGTRIFIWLDERFAGVTQSFGNINVEASNIKFDGWLVKDRSKLRYATSELEFEAVGIIELLDTLAGFSQVLITKSNPSAWFEYRHLSILRSVIYLLRYGTTALVSVDLRSSIISFLYPRLYIQAQTAMGQIRELIEGAQGEITSDRTSMILINKNLPLTILDADRNDAVVCFELTDDDASETEFEREHRQPVAQVEARGFTGAANNSDLPALPVFARAPGDAPAEGAGRPVEDRLIVGSPTWLEQVSGHLYGRANSLYLEEKRPRAIPVNASIRYNFLDFYQQWTHLTLSASYNKRGIDFHEQRTVLQSVSETYDAVRGSDGRQVNTGSTSLSFVPETRGYPGVRFTPKTGSGSNTPPRETGTEAPLPTGQLFKGIKSLLAVSINRRLAWTTNLDAAEPNWTVENMPAGVDADIIQVVYDAESTASSLNFYLFTATKIQHLTGCGIGQTRAVNTLKTFRATLNALTQPNRSADMSFGNLGWGFCSSMYADGVWYTYDKGAGWVDEVQINANGHNSSSEPQMPGAYISSGKSGQEGFCLTSAKDTNAHDANTTGYVVRIAAGSPAAVVSNGSNGPALTGKQAARGLRVPYADNQQDLIAYFGYNDQASSGAAAEQRLYRAVGATLTDISPIVSGDKFGPIRDRGVGTSFQNPNVLVLCGRHYDGSSNPSKLGVFGTRNGLDDTPLWTSFKDVTLNEFFYINCAIAGDDDEVVYFWGTDNNDSGGPLIGYTSDFGASGIQDKTGDLPADFGEILNIAGLGA